MGTYLVVDGNSLTYRAFFALPDRHGHGERAGHQRGVRLHVDADQRAQGPPPRRRAGRLRPARADVPPRGRAAYKAQRDAAPDILRQQMGLVREVLDALGITSSTCPAGRPTTSSPPPPTASSTRGHQVIIVTGDRDSYQLVADPHVKVLYNKRGVSDYAFYDEAGIEERTGVTPGAVPAVRRAARRPQRQPARRARRGGEDGGQADHHLRRPRRHLRARRRADPEAAREPRRARGAGPQEPRADAAAPRRADRRRPRRPRA